MDRLSSCYFCGAALDVSLSEHPVVPKDLQSADDQGPTVVLCSTCRRKLGGIIEAVVAAGETETDGDVLAADTDTEAPPSANAAGRADTTTNDADATDPGEGSDLRTPAEGEPDDADATDPGETSDLRTPSEGASDDGEDVSTDLGEEASADGPTLTKLEYNKVMRLLQNRQFPVDRAEIREVATSAYDLDPAEFDAVIDAAVERDLLAEENGQFVDPE